MKSELEKFYDLKQKVLLKYQEHFVFFNGNWKSFSSQDILNLISLIEQKTNQTISEKWIYTHLKPSENQKLPRKDTLDILSKFAGFSCWDEFIFEKPAVSKSNKSKLFLSEHKWKLFFGMVLLIVFFLNLFRNKKSETIELKNEFTNEKVSFDDVKVYKIEKNQKTPIVVKDAKIDLSTVSEKSKIVIESPYFKKKTVTLNTDEKNEIFLQPDDNAMLLKGFMKSELKDWQTRKLKLNEILAIDLEVIIMLKNDLGFESYNKDEFAQKLILPTESLRKMQIIEIKKSEDSKINFIRIKQE